MTRQTGVLTAQVNLLFLRARSLETVLISTCDMEKSFSRKEKNVCDDKVLIRGKFGISENMFGLVAQKCKVCPENVTKKKFCMYDNLNFTSF